MLLQTPEGELKMKFEEAIKLLKEGKKVKRKRHEMWFLIPFDDGENVFTYQDVFADDWEEYVVEDNWSLESKVSEHKVFSKHDSFERQFVEKLKEKIMEDITRKVEPYVCYSGDTDQIDAMREIIVKRFGF